MGRLTVDLRGLAAFRASLGLTLLLDLGLRATALTEFYTDEGVLPRDVYAEIYPTMSSLSLHSVSGDLWFQLVLFALAASAAVAVCVGWRTKPALAVTLLLLLSMHARNRLVLNGGDRVLAILVLLALLLPVSRRWSVDSLQRGNNPADDDQVLSVAGAVLLLHVVVIYLTNLGFKLQRGFWLTGDAVAHVMRMDRFTILLGEHVAEMPLVLTGLNWSWLLLLAASPSLVMLTGRRRVLAVAAYLSAHVGMMLTMRLGAFPLAMTTALVPFLPTGFWNYAEPKLSFLEDAASELGERDSIPEETAGAPPWRGSPSAALSSVAAASFLAFTLAWQGMALDIAPTPDPLEETASPDEYLTWRMFAFDGPGYDAWYVAPAQLESGETVDVYRGGEVDWDRPPDVDATYDGPLWHRYLTDLPNAGDDAQDAFADYLCRRGHRSDEAVEVSVHVVRQRTRHDGYADPWETELARRSCPG